MSADPPTSPELLLYGLPADADPSETWKETLLIGGPNVTDADRDRVEKLAAADGFHSFRRATFNPGTRPDFVGALQ